MRLRINSAVQCALCIGAMISFAFISSINAQPTLRADRTRALIGDALSLTLQVPTAGGKWLNQDVVPADTVASIHVLDFSTAQGSAGGPMVKTWRIAVYDTGIVRVPPVPVILEHDGRQDTSFSNDIPLQISGVTDSLGIAPIKNIIHEPVTFSDYFPYIGGVLALLLLAGLGYYFYKKPKKEQEIIEIRDEKPAHIIALQKLDELESKKLWQGGMVKEYHSEVSHIMREYLEARYGILALESTSSEIISQLREKHIDEELLQRTNNMMRIEDLVKFAKAEPPIELHEQHLKFARDLVNKTKTKSLSETDQQPSTEHPVSSTEHPASSTEHPVSSTGKP